MCPACFATVAWIAAGTASTGGLVAYFIRKFRRKPAAINRVERSVSEGEWLKARKSLLAKEKAHTRQRDELSRLRRELPWVKIS